MIQEEETFHTLNNWGESLYNKKERKIMIILAAKEALKAFKCLAHIAIEKRELNYWGMESERERRR